MTPTQREAALRLADDLAEAASATTRPTLLVCAATVLRELATVAEMETVCTYPDCGCPIDQGSTCGKGFTIQSAEPQSEPALRLRELATVAEMETVEPQSEPVARPPTPVGWSDTDWVKHLECLPPIGYAVRDTLYGTSKAGVLRFCSSDEAGAFAVYASPQPQQTEPSQDSPPQIP